MLKKKRKIFYIPHYSILLLILLGYESCREKCEDTNTNLIKVKFFNATTLQEDTLAFQRITGIGATIIADSTNLYNPTVKRTVFSLPTNPSADEVSFLWERSIDTKLIQDTLTLSYTRTLELIPPNCGLNEIIQNLDILSHSFDSASVVSNSLSNQENQINIHVFIQK